jgi:endoglycosylceramidase
VIVDPLKPPTEDNLRPEILDFLVRPYPRAVAGTPTRFSYDRATHIFELEYSTLRAGSAQRFGASARTEVFVPARRYPTGYIAEVSGGRVVSQANAQVLRVAADSLATAVTVRVRPR